MYLVVENHFHAVFSQVERQEKVTNLKKLTISVVYEPPYAPVIIQGEKGKAAFHWTNLYPVLCLRRLDFVKIADHFFLIILI